MTPHNYEIVDCGAFCEVIFFCIPPKNLLRDFFDSLSCVPLLGILLKCLISINKYQRVYLIDFELSFCMFNTSQSEFL